MAVVFSAPSWVLDDLSNGGIGKDGGILFHHMLSMTTAEEDSTDDTSGGMNGHGQPVP